MVQTLNQLAQLLDARLEGEGETRIEGVSSLKKGLPGKIVFAENEKGQKEAEKNRAAAIILPQNTLPAKKPALRVDNPRLAFCRVAALFAPDYLAGEGIHSSAHLAQEADLGEGVVVHPQVVIESGVKVGTGTVIGAQAFIGRGATIGERVRIYPGVRILAGTEIGDDCVIQSGAVIGSEGFGFVQEENGEHLRMPQTGKVVLEEKVEIGANSVVDRGALDETRIEAGSKIDSLVMIAHNVRIGRRCLLVGQSGVAGSSILGEDVTLGGQAAVSDHIQIDSGVVLGGKSAASKNLPGPGRYFGIPAFPAREAFRMQAGIRNIPRFRDKIKELEEEVQKLKKELEDEKSK